jgi:hypothetical protein
VPRRTFHAPHFRRYAQKPTPESLYDQYAAEVTKNQSPNHRPEQPVSFELFKQALEDEELYDQYVASASAKLPPEPVVSFEDFQQALEDLERNGLPDLDQHAQQSTSVPLQGKYDDMLAALLEMEPTDPGYKQTLDTLSDAVEDNLEDHVGDSLFQRRLESLNVLGSERELAQRVAQLVLSTTDTEALAQQPRLSTTDKAALGLIEDKLAPYNGPLATLNVAIEWYLQHPEQIALPDESECDLAPL